MLRNSRTEERPRSANWSNLSLQFFCELLLEAHCSRKLQWFNESLSARCFTILWLLTIASSLPWITELFEHFRLPFLWGIRGCFDLKSETLCWSDLSIKHILEDNPWEGSSDCYNYKLKLFLLISEPIRLSGKGKDPTVSCCDLFAVTDDNLSRNDRFPRDCDARRPIPINERVSIRSRQ